MRIKQAKDTFAEVINQTYGQKVETLDADVASLQAHYQQENKTLAEYAQAHKEAAMKRIRSLIIPEGTA